MADHGEEEFEEAEVWAAMSHDDCPLHAAGRNHDSKQASDHSSSWKKKKHHSSPATKNMTQHTVAAPSLGSGRRSAPVSIPDWSKIYGSGSKAKAAHERQGDVDGENGEEMVPPHEWLARRTSSSLSVCEGAGRTLKGRDLSRVRNSVLYKTGFLEQ